MKLVYAVDKLSYNNKDHIGVVKKVESQMRLFNSNGIETKLCQYEWQGGYPQIEVDGDTDVLYFRRIEPSLKLIIKLMELKKKSKGLRFIMEIPTYPFAGEERGRVSFKRKINRILGECLIRFWVDRIVLIAQPTIKKLYGIPVLNAVNGVDFKSILAKNTVVPVDSMKGIHLICVSGCFFWHGYDRMIEGLRLYYDTKKANEKVYFHIVGEGECLEEYKELAKKYNLYDKYVFFHGRKVGKELDEIYDMCDVALDCLGTHRKGMFYASSLKSKEYAAKGLPIVSSLQLDIHNEDTDCLIQMLPADDKAVEVEKIVEFYHKIYDEKEVKEVIEGIRSRFYQYCDWEFAFKDVLNYIEDKK